MPTEYDGPCRAIFLDKCLTEVYLVPDVYPRLAALKATDGYLKVPTEPYHIQEAIRMILPIFNTDDADDSNDTNDTDDADDTDECDHSVTASDTGEGDNSVAESDTDECDNSVAESDTDECDNSVTESDTDEYDHSVLGCAIHFLNQLATRITDFDVNTVEFPDKEKERLKNDIAGLAARVKTLSDKNEELSQQTHSDLHKIAYNEAKIENLKSRIESLEADNNSLREELRKEQEIDARHCEGPLSSVVVYNSLVQMVATLSAENGSLKAENKFLTTENDRLKAENKSLTTENKLLTDAAAKASLDQTYAKVDQTFDEVDQTAAKLDQAVAELHQGVAKGDAGDKDKDGHGNNRESPLSSAVDYNSLVQMVATLSAENGSLMTGVKYLSAAIDVELKRACSKSDVFESSAGVKDLDGHRKSISTSSDTPLTAPPTHDPYFKVFTHIVNTLHSIESRLNGGRLHHTDVASLLPGSHISTSNTASNTTGNFEKLDKIVESVEQNHARPEHENAPTDADSVKTGSEGVKSYEASERQVHVDINMRDNQHPGCPHAETVHASSQVQQPVQQPSREHHLLETYFTDLRDDPGYQHVLQYLRLREEVCALKNARQQNASVKSTGSSGSESSWTTLGPAN